MAVLRCRLPLERCQDAKTNISGFVHSITLIHWQKSSRTATVRVIFEMLDVILQTWKNALEFERTNCFKVVVVRNTISNCKYHLHYT